MIKIAHFKAILDITIALLFMFKKIAIAFLSRYIIEPKIGLKCRFFKILNIAIAYNRSFFMIEAHLCGRYLYTVCTSTSEFFTALTWLANYFYFFSDLLNSYNFTILYGECTKLTFIFEGTNFLSILIKNVLFFSPH